MEFLAESIGLLDMTPPSVSSREGATTVFVRPDGGNSSSSGLRDDVSADGSGAGSGHNSAPCRGGSMGGHISRSLLFNPWQSWEHSRDNDREDELHHGEKGKIEKSKLDCDVESNGTTRGGQGGEGVGAVSGPSDAAGKTNALQKVVKSAEHISTLQESPQNGISSSPPQQVESSNNSNEFTTNGVSGDSYYEALTKYLGLHLSFSTLTKSPSASDIATATSFSLFHALAQTVSTSDTLESTTMDGSPSVADESAASTVQASSTSARMATMSAPATATITTPNAMHLTRSKQAPEVPAENIITKHITQRIDARTNYHCFTGNIDAVTGHLIHGTMLHRFTGEVYEGPFCATAVKDSKQNGENDDSNPGQADLDDDADDNNLDSSYYETVSLRHGNNATCRYANGLKFVGRFEWDHPKSGTWIMAGEWTYEGSVIVVDDNKDDYNNRNKFTIGYAKKILGMKARDKKMKQTAGASENNLTKLQTTKKLIGITGPLPGSVIFHGMGRFIRSDGLVYQGEFHHGLASGVGKEILPNGKGVYHGEFSGGLRHGVGTLIEECVMDEEMIAEAIEEGEGECDCNRSHRQDSDCGSLDDKAFANGPHQREVSSTTYHSDRVNTSCDNPINELARFDSDHGPDFAAGGSDSLSSSGDGPSLNLAELDGDAENTAPRFSNYKDDTNAHIDVSFQETNPVSSPNKCTCKSPRDTQSARKRRQHYSSGVWCAGQFEIEDSHGTVFPDSNEVIEEWNRAKLGPMVDEPAKVGGAKEHCEVNDQIGSGDNRSDDYEGQIDQLNTVASLNRTTWDLLPEKWLGLGK